jgi:hypothetical protein
LLDDHIRIKVASTLNLKVEPLRGCIVVKRLAFLGWLFPFCILALGPVDVSEDESKNARANSPFRDSVLLIPEVHMP